MMARTELGPPMPDHPPTLGLILAGGAGRRLGGLDKTLLEIGGRRILDRASAVLRPDCVLLAISANGDPARFGAAGMVVLADPDGGGSGPLAGILAGLDHAAAYAPPLGFVASVAGDAPFLPAGLVRDLHAARGDAPAVIAMSDGRRHPAIGLWSVALRHRLRQALADGERRVGRWADAVGTASAAWAADPVDPFLNVNEPGDLAAARALAAR